MKINKTMIAIVTVLIIIIGIAWFVKSEHDKFQAANDNIINSEYDKSKAETFY